MKLKQVFDDLKGEATYSEEETAVTNLVVVGHLVIDHIFVKGAFHKPTVGGPPTYAGIAAAMMGCTVKVVSKIGGDFPDHHLQFLESHGIDLSGVQRVRGARTTSYRIVYEDGVRKMRLLGLCDPIIPDDVPEGMKADGVLLGPVAQEVPTQTIEVLSSLSPCLSLDPQGYLRRFDVENVMTDAEGFDMGLLKSVKVLKATRRELALITGFEDTLKACQLIKALGPEIIIATGGSSETLVYEKEGGFMVPSWPSEVIDPTGAGDAFLGAFLAEYLGGRELPWCACVGNASASFVVEGYGPSRFGSREEVYGRAEKLLKGLKKIM